MSKGPKDKLFLKLVKPLQDELNQERDQDKLLTEQLEAITESLSSMTNELENRSKLSFAIHEQLWDLEVTTKPNQTTPDTTTLAATAPRNKLVATVERNIPHGRLTDPTLLLFLPPLPDAPQQSVP